jgi:hypothetical protein
VTKLLAIYHKRYLWLALKVADVIADFQKAQLTISRSLFLAVESDTVNLSFDVVVFSSPCHSTTVAFFTCDTKGVGLMWAL